MNCNEERENEQAKGTDRPAMILDWFLVQEGDTG